MNANIRSMLGIWVMNRGTSKLLVSTGSGVAVWRDERVNDVYIATAYHVIFGNSTNPIDPRIHNYVLVDSSNYKYVLNDTNIVIRDREHDYCLLRISQSILGSRTIPTVKISMDDIFSEDSYIVGDRCYAIGFPYAKDINSICHGTIRSSKWTATGTLDNLLISAPLFPGNSGGGVFLERTNKLIGIVIAILGGRIEVTDYFTLQTFIFPNFPHSTLGLAIPTYVIRESIFFLMYSDIQTFPVPYYATQYFLGIDGFTMVTADTIERIGSISRDLNFEFNSLFDKKGVFGFQIDRILPNSPFAIQSGLRVDRMRSYFVWAVSFDRLNWELITEENPLSYIFHNHLVNRVRSFRPFNSYRAISLTDPAERSERELLLDRMPVKVRTGDTLYLIMSEIFEGVYTFKNIVSITLQEITRKEALEQFSNSMGTEFYISNEQAFNMPHDPVFISNSSDSNV